MNNSWLRGVAALLLLASAWQVQGADAQQVADLQQVSEDASLRDSTLSSISGVAFEAGEENKVARLRWSRNTGTGSFSAALSVPVDEKESSSTLADLDGLGKALTFAGSYTHYFTGGFDQQDLNEQNAICEHLHIANQCDNDHVDQVGTPADLRAFNYASVANSWTPFINFEGKVGRQGVDYFNSTTLAKLNDSEAPYAATVGAGWLGLSWVFSARAKLQKAVKEKDKVTYCTPATVDARAEDCATLAFGAPTLETSTVLSIEYRRFYKYIAVSPLLSHNLKTDQTGIELPIFFMRDATGQFTGGVRFAYKTDDDDNGVTASIFVAKALSL